MKTYTQWLPALAIVFAGCGGGSGDHSHGHHGHDHGPTPPPAEITLSTAAMEQNAVRVEPLIRRTFQPTREVAARVAFNEETTAHVGTLVHGRVVKMQASRRLLVHRKQFIVLAAELSPRLQPLRARLHGLLQAIRCRSLHEAAAWLCGGDGILRGHGGDALRRCLRWWCRGPRFTGLGAAGAPHE